MLKVDFQDGGSGSHVGFRIGTILAIFDLLVILITITKFQGNRIIGSGGDVKNLKVYDRRRRTTTTTTTTDDADGRKVMTNTFYVQAQTKGLGAPH